MRLVLYECDGCSIRCIMLVTQLMFIFGLFQGKWSNFKHMEKHFPASTGKLSLQKHRKPPRWGGWDRKSSAQFSMLQAFGVIFPWQRSDSGYLQRSWYFSSFGSFKSQCISNLVIDSWKAGTLWGFLNCWFVAVDSMKLKTDSCIRALFNM